MTQKAYLGFNGLTKAIFSTFRLRVAVLIWIVPDRNQQFCSDRKLNMPYEGPPLRRANGLDDRCDLFDLIGPKLVPMGVRSDRTKLDPHTVADPTVSTREQEVSQYPHPILYLVLGVIHF